MLEYVLWSSTSVYHAPLYASERFNNASNFRCVGRGPLYNRCRPCVGPGGAFLRNQWWACARLLWGTGSRSSYAGVEGALQPQTSTVQCRWNVDVIYTVSFRSTVISQVVLHGKHRVPGCSSGCM